MSDPLLKLFGSAARVKLLRLFLFNPKASFTIPEMAERARITERAVRKEVKLFNNIKLIERVRRPARAAGIRYTLSSDFTYLEAMQNLLLNAPARGGELYERTRHTGALKLIILSGVFLGEWEGRLDILIVGDRVEERKLRERIKRLESEIGKELRYALLTTEDFFYRLNMNDHLVRDVLDYPHQIVLDRLNIGLK